MSYIGMSWIDSELRRAIADAEDDQHAFALAATALVGEVRVGLAKLTAEVAGMVSQQAETTRVLREVVDAIDQNSQAIADVNVRPEEIALTGVRAADVEAAVAKAREEPPNGDRTFENDEEDDDLLIAPLGGGGFVVGRRDAFRDDGDDDDDDKAAV